MIEAQQQQIFTGHDGPARDSSRRAKIVIVSDVLAALRGKQLKLTHLIYKSNLSYPRLKVYLERLIANGYVAELAVPDGTVYELTDSGLAFHAECVRVSQRFKAFT